MSFDFNNTCFKIDKSKEQFKQELTDNLSNLIDECCPLLEGEARNKLLHEYTSDIFNEFENSFEEVRDTNTDMRYEAENQIEILERMNDDLENQIEHLENTIEQKAEEIIMLMEQLGEVKMNIMDNKYGV